MLYRITWFLFAFFILAGCNLGHQEKATTGNINQVKLGMDKPEVKDILGAPDNKKLMATHRKTGDSLIIWFYKDKYAIHFYGHEARTIITNLLEHRKLMKQYVEAKQSDQKEKADSLIEVSEAYVRKMQPSEVEK